MSKITKIPKLNDPIIVREKVFGLKDFTLKVWVQDMKRMKWR